VLQSGARKPECGRLIDIAGCGANLTVDIQMVQKELCASQSDLQS
jgi:hypothetical protein